MKKDRNMNGIPIKEALEGFYRAMGIDDKMHETQILSQWEELMGKVVAARTERKYIKDKVLYLHINSSVMRNELVQQKEEIVQKINTVAGCELITGVFLK